MTQSETKATLAKQEQQTTSTKDAGRVRIGAGLLRFTADPATKNAGRVHLGAGLMRF